jgi:hypothetical protein
MPSKNHFFLLVVAGFGGNDKQKQEILRRQKSAQTPLL